MVVLRNSLTIIITASQRAQRVLVSLGGRSFIPFYGLAVIPFHSHTVGIALAQAVLGAFMALPGRSLIPFHRLCRIYGNALTMFIADRQVLLGIRIAPLRAFYVPVHGFLPILFHPLALVVAISQAALCSCVPLGRRLFKPCHCGGKILGGIDTPLVAVPHHILCQRITRLCGDPAFLHVKPMVLPRQIILDDIVFPSHFHTPPSQAQILYIPASIPFIYSFRPGFNALPPGKTDTADTGRLSGLQA